MVNSLVLPLGTTGLTVAQVVEGRKVWWCLISLWLKISRKGSVRSQPGLASVRRCWHFCCLPLCSPPHPLFIFDLFRKVSLLTSCTVLIKGFLLIAEPLWANRAPPTLIYQSTGEMSAWHMAQSVSHADFNGFRFHFFIFFKSSILKWWSAQSQNASTIYLFIYFI